MRSKSQDIEEELKLIETRLANAREYVAQNINVEGSPWLHLDDWRGKSGHPLWMSNSMMPTLMKRRARKERALRNIDSKTKEKSLSLRKRRRLFEI